MAADLHKYFRAEAAEILDGLGKGAIELERGAVPAEITPNLLRLAHTLKGAARVVKHAGLARLSHELEDALAPQRERVTPVEQERIREIFGLLDAMAREVASLSGAPAAAAATVAAVGPTGASNEDAVGTVRAELAEIDALTEGLTELEVRLGAFRASRRALEGAHRATGRLARALDERLRPMVDDVDVALRAIEQAYDSALDRVERELREVRDSAERLRLVRASTVFASLERVVRDAGDLTRKRVGFVAAGGDVRLDAHVLAILQPALVQLVRNAVAHGIEPESARIAARKPAAGSIELTVLRRGRRASFFCKDDGAGIDLESVRRVALERGLGPEEARGLDADALLRLLLQGGITTSRTLSQVAGRGVGLDVVRDAVARARGELRVSSSPGRGTSFEISVPISVASVEALLVEVDGAQAAVPIDAVRRSLRVQRADLAHAADGTTILLDDEAIPFVSLSDVLCTRGAKPAARASEASPAIVVVAGGASAALGVDRLLGTARVTLRSLSPLAHASAIVAAASIDAEGDPRLVLDPEALVEAARNARPVSFEAPAPRLPVLVIDDSLTTRMLEQSILESAGYEVDLASSGEEGLAKAAKRAYGLFLVDVEMPGMDGFAFVAETRAHPELRKTPAILVTSRSAPEDRQRGLDAGARAYVVKGELDQTELLRTIGHWMQEAR
jgi:two-component system chemotaxis sensor kinase CheA